MSYITRESNIKSDATTIKSEDIISRIIKLFTFNPNDYATKPETTKQPETETPKLPDIKDRFKDWFNNFTKYIQEQTTKIWTTEKVNGTDEEKDITWDVKAYYMLIYFIWLISRIILFFLLIIPAIISAILYGIYLFLLNYPEYGLYILLGLIIFIGTIIQLVYYVPPAHPTHSNKTSTSCPTQNNALLSTPMPTTASNTAPRSINNLSTNVVQQQEPTQQYTRDMISELISETVGLNETYEKMYDSRNVDLRKSFYETISIQILEKWRNVLFIVYFLAFIFYSFIIFASGNLTIFEKIKKIIIALIVTNIYFIKFVIITVYWLYNYVSGGTLFG